MKKPEKKPKDDAPPASTRVAEAQKALTAAGAAVEANRAERERLAEEAAGLWGKMGDPATSDRDALISGARRQVCEARGGRLDAELPQLEAQAQAAQRDLEAAEAAQAQEQIDGLMAGKGQCNAATEAALDALLAAIEQGHAVLIAADELAGRFALPTPPRNRFLVPRTVRLRPGADELRRMLALDFIISE